MSSVFNSTSAQHEFWGFDVSKYATLAKILQNLASTAYLLISNSQNGNLEPDAEKIGIEIKYSTNGKIKHFLQIYYYFDAPHGVFK